MTHNGAGLDHPKSPTDVDELARDERVNAPSQPLGYRQSPAPWPLENAVKWISGHVFSSRKISAEGADFNSDRRQRQALLNAGALQNAIFNSANFSSIATDAEGVI